MSEVRFQVGTEHEVVPVEIYATDLTLIDRVLSSEAVVTLGRGSYLAVGRTADGRELRAGFDVRPGPDVLSVDLTPLGQRHASLEFAPPARWANALRAVIRAARRFEEPVVSEYALSSDVQWTRVRKHRAGDRGWQHLDRLDVDAVMLSHRAGQPECVRVPRSVWAFLVVALRTGESDQAWLDVRLANAQADALLRLLDRGEIGAAQTLAGSPALTAEELLRGKSQDPVAAAAGAYALLRLGDVERLRDWTVDLRERFICLPDGLAVHAEHLARLGRHDEAAAALRELPSRGLPCFSMGVGFATDRLRSYAREWPGDKKIANALTHLTQFAVATDFTRPITTFTCTAPDVPVAPGPPPPPSLARRMLRGVLPTERTDATGRPVFQWRVRLPSALTSGTRSLRRVATMDKARMAFAAIVTAIFLVAAIYLITNADTKDSNEWERLVYVFGAFEAIAFAAIGWVFGTEVNRQRADNAEERAGQAEQEKDTEKEKGRTLAGMVVGRGGGGQGGRPRLEGQGPGGAGGAPDPAVEYARRAYDIEV
jgi:hypothetical protein